MLLKAVDIIKKRKREEKEEGEKRETEGNQKRAKRGELVKLETQKYLREIRTRNGQLKKLISVISK